MLAKFPKPAGCADCSLKDTGLGFAYPSGPVNADLLFVGEALGYNEAIQGIPFVGAAGGMFHKILSRAEVSRDHSKVHNVVNCRPPDDWLSGAPWEHSATAHCRQYLEASLANPALKVVVTLGETALKNVLNLYGVEGVRVQDFHGTVHRDPTDRFWVVPTYHPSHLQRGANNLLDVVRFDVQVAHGIIRNGGQYPRRPVSLLLDPPAARFQVWATSVLERVAQDPFANGGLAVDIETPDKSGGRDEGELTTEERSTQIDRVNFSYGFDEGITVPYEGPYIEIIESLLNCGVSLSLWNKGYDEPRLRFNGHTFQTGPDRRPVEILDLMWAAHHYQSDWPLGLGFWAPFASDYGAWKHLSRQPGQTTLYAAIDGLQTKRLEIYLTSKLVQAGLWDAFYRHTHLREQYVLRPAHENGMPISLERLDAFHEKCQAAATAELVEIQKSDIAGAMKPKLGYAKKPKGKACGSCDGTGSGIAEDGITIVKGSCTYCTGTGSLPPDPPKSVVGDYAAKGDQAKADYINQGVELVERPIEIQVLQCSICAEIGVKKSHDCTKAPKVKKAKGKKRAQDLGGDTPAVDPGVELAQVEENALLPATADQAGEPPAPVGHLHIVKQTQNRWFWKLPFNPDANAQMLAFIRASGEQPGKAKKTKKDTADKETLRKLYKKTGNPVYLHTLNYKAIKKVDSTYVIGSKKRIWADGRLHPYITFRPSMMRDSCVNPNVQNVIADKDKSADGKAPLAAGFRNCIVADPGYRLVEADFAGIEAVDTGWLSGDPDYIRLATLGVHAYLTSHVLAEARTIGSPASLAWSDGDLAIFFKEIKKKFPAEYDKCKRVVHGNNYGLTTYGMVQNFPDVFTGGLKEATHFQDLYYALAPKLPKYHQKMRNFAYENGYLGGPYVDDYTLLTRGGNHPFSYMHWFWGVQSFVPMNESEYRKKLWIAVNRMGLKQHPKCVIINNRPFEIIMGEDSKRVIAFPPQSIAGGQLKEAEISLFHPESPYYMGEIADGKTPLIAPIHDSLLLHVPDRMVDWVVMNVLQVMRTPFWQMPMPAEWNMGSHLRVNVSVKVSPIGGSWADCEEIQIPDMAPATASEILYLPVEEDQYEDVGDLATRVVM